MTEYPESQSPSPQPSPNGWSTWPGVSSATAPAPNFQQPGVYPPPPEFYEQAAQRPPVAPYPSGYAPYPYYPPQAQYPGPAGYPAYPMYPPYPAQQAAVATPEPDTRVRLFWPVVSAIVSFAVYAVAFGWQFGLGIMALLLVHEMGHFVVIRAKGMPAGLPTFIPLVGAFVTMRRSPSNARDEAEIALAGPLAGTIGGVVCLIAYWRTGLPVLIPLAYYSFLLNLLNLIPVPPLDGSRVTGAISKWIWLIGLVGVAIGAYMTHSLLLVILGVFGGYQLIRRFGESGSNYYKISLGSRIMLTLVYFGLAGVLAYATYMLQPLMGHVGGSF